MSWLTHDLGPELYIAYNSGRIRVSTEQALANKRYIALFFGGNWCNGCKAFLPLLIQAYTSRVSPNDLELIFVSYCENETAFRGCMEFMSWPAIPYDNKRIRENLRERYAISELPRVILLDGSTGWIIHDSVQKIIQNTSSFNSVLPPITLKSTTVTTKTSVSSSLSHPYGNAMQEDINMTDNISLPFGNTPYHSTFSSSSSSSLSSFASSHSQFTAQQQQHSASPAMNPSSSDNNSNASSNTGLAPLNCKGC